MRSRPGLAASFTLTALCFALCFGTSRAADLRIGFTVDAATLDPAAYTYRDNETLLRLMYDGLTTHGPGMKVVGELAQSWHQTDPLTYEFTLRKGVRFHDGGELTADDVVFTLQRLMTPNAVNGKNSPRRPAQTCQALAGVARHALLPGDHQRSLRPKGRRRLGNPGERDRSVPSARLAPRRADGAPAFPRLLRWPHRRAA
jgi:ABC-type transport system substrate-binding protein